MKKISQIIAYSLLGIVVLGLVLTAVLKKDFSPNISMPNEQGICIMRESPSASDGLGNETDYNKFITEYKNSFKLTILYAIFSGEINKKQEVKYYGKTEPFNSSDIVVYFSYSSEQILKANGQVWIDSVNSDTEIKYKKVAFKVEKGKGLTTQSIYFETTNNSYYVLTTLANYDSLYDFISTLTMFKEQE